MGIEILGPIELAAMRRAGRAAAATLATADGSLSAQFEHTVLVTRDGCEILTLPPA